MSLADRAFHLVRGRNEFCVYMSGASVFYSDMPTSSGAEGGDGGALMRSSYLLEKHWDELPNATYEDVQMWLRNA